MDRKMFETGYNKDYNKAHDMNDELNRIEKRTAEIKGKPETGKEQSRELNGEEVTKWFQENGLESFELPKKIAEQEKYWQSVYGPDFRFDLTKIHRSVESLEIVKKAIEAGCARTVIFKARQEKLSEEDSQTTGAESVFRKCAEPLEKKGFKIWEKTGKERWTQLEHREFLQRCNPTDPEEFNAKALQEDWVAEEIRVIDRKGAPAKIKAGELEMIFTDDRADIPRDQKIVNKRGEAVTPDNYSYISAVINNVRLLSTEEGIILASQLYAKDKTYLASSTWERRRDVVDHRDKKTNPPVSVARARSYGSEFNLGSDSADDSDSSDRWRAAY